MCPRREARAHPAAALTDSNPPAVIRLLDAAAAGLARLNDPLTRAGLALSGVLVASMLALALAQIGSRALFNYTLDWAEESARFALVWTVLAAAPYAYRRGQHVAIDAFAAALPPRLMYVTSLLLNLLVLAILARFLFEAIHFWERGLSMVASALPMPMAWIYSIVPVSFAGMLLAGLELSLRLARSLWRPDPLLTLAGTVAGVTAE